MDIVDKRKFPNFMKALWDISFGKYSYKLERVLGLGLFLLIALLAWYVQMPGRTVITVAVACLIGLPFFEAYVMYESKMFIDEKKLIIKFKSFKLRSCRLENIVKIVRSKNWGGSYFVKVKGYSKANGFILLQDSLPEQFANFEVVEE